MRHMSELKSWDDVLLHQYLWLVLRIVTQLIKKIYGWFSRFDWWKSHGGLWQTTEGLVSALTGNAGSATEALFFLLRSTLLLHHRRVSPEHVLTGKTRRVCRGFSAASVSTAANNKAPEAERPYFLSETNTHAHTRVKAKTEPGTKLRYFCCILEKILSLYAAFFIFFSWFAAKID